MRTTIGVVVAVALVALAVFAPSRGRALDMGEYHYIVCDGSKLAVVPTGCVKQLNYWGDVLPLGWARVYLTGERQDPADPTVMLSKSVEIHVCGMCLKSPGTVGAIITKALQ